MKLKSILPLGALLAAFIISSCAPPPMSPAAASNIVTGGLRSGDSAVTRESIDSILNSPAERPGLATGWGAERNSEMSYTSFVRASSKPVGTDAIFYNNSEGIQAMARAPEKVGPMQTAAGGLVEWGIKGGTGYLPAYKRGYIVYPGETLEIDGFRKSESKVAAFEFSGVSDSYANLRHGDTRNVGVIGLAVFTQKGVDPWTWSSGEVNRRNSASPFAVAP